MLNETMQNRIGDLSGALMALKMHPKSAIVLQDIRSAINAIFKNDKGDGVCKQVIFTENTDKLFFGIVVMPVIPADKIIDILMKDEHYIIPEVYVELDSKLFSEMLDLDVNEITALVLREVDHMVSDARPMEQIKNDIDNYLYKKGENIKLSDSVHYMELLSFGVRDAIRKTVSIFEATKDHITDQSDDDMEITEDLRSAMNKIDNNGFNFNSEIDNKLIFLSWVLRLYRDVLTYRVNAIYTLKHSIRLTPSVLEQKEMKNIISRLERIDDDSLLQEGSVLGSIVDAFRRTSGDMKRNGIKRYEDDFYEIQFEVNNIETQEEAMLLLHRINSRMCVIDDYISTEEMNKSDYHRWTGLYQKYGALRATLAKNKIYQNKTRLYVNYGMDD